MCEIIVDKNVDAVLISGDVFDRSVSSAEAIRTYDKAMTKICCELKKKVFVIAGNHDSAERLSSCGELLERAGLYVCGALSGVPRKILLEDTEIFLLPWITESKVKSVYPNRQEEITDLTSAYQVVLDNFRSDFTKGKRHILLSHAFITNSETSTSDRAAEVGFATQVPSFVFEGFDYVALGHIHKPQDVNDYIRYSGTPMPYSFGKEENQEKSVTIIDTNDMSHEIVALPLLHRRTSLTGTLDELLNKEYPEEVLNGYVRLNITDQYMGLNAISELINRYPNALEFSGKTYEKGNSTISLTIEDLEKLSSDPIEVFKQFCNEIIGESADDHLQELFRNAVDAATEEE